MWSKTRKALYDRLAPSLKGKVVYEVQCYQRLKCDCSMCGDNKKQFAIIINRKEVHTLSGIGKFYDDEVWDKVIKELDMADKMRGYCTPMPEYEKVITNRVFYYTGVMLFSTLMKKVHTYLNEVSIEECLLGEDYFLYLLAILDRRVGKRKIKAIYDGIDTQPEWIRRFILLRAEAEGITHKKYQTKVWAAGVTCSPIYFKEKGEIDWES